MARGRRLGSRCSPRRADPPAQGCLDGEGNGNYTMENGEVWVYEAAWFSGNGTLQGEPVRCLTAQGQAACHTGYELDEEDRRDMTALRDRFGVDLLPEQGCPWRT
ncbi:nucleotidyltransferase domain-containing protein [Streptomyces sp. NBC_00932]|uniref:nucleotidyltransferase domain-containing protein n=2 Tax=unclassified Streptomyces TaxID=2593676 RepID=UPI0038638F0F